MRAADYDPFDPSVLERHHDWLRMLRAEAPVSWVAARRYWALVRFDDVHTALRDHATYSSAKGNSPEPGLRLGLIAEDPPKHTRLRRIVQGVFTPKTIERTWAPRIREICERLVDEALPGSRVDAIRALTLPLPIQVIAEMLGVPDGDLAQFKRWSDDMVVGVNLHLDQGVRARAEEAFKGLLGYFAAQIARRRARPADDLISMICEAGEDERLTEREVMYFCTLLLIAGNETTTNLLGNGLLALLDHPAEEALLRARPDLVPAAIEEMLRFCPPTQAVFRQTTADVTVRGVDIPADSRVMLSLVGANRDEARHPDPDRFWIERPDNEHVAFGSGIHFCLGSALARLEVRTMLEVLLARTSAFRRAGEPRFMSTIVVKGPTELPMELVPR